MLKQMQYFVSVVDYNSFSKAAQECFISQSAISQQIKALEQTLGVQLLTRVKKSFSLTSAGEYFYKHCKEILKDVEDLIQNTRDIEDDENVLKIGYLRGYPGKELREAILEFSRLYSHVSLELTRGNHEELYHMITNNEASLVVSDQRRAFHDDYINHHLMHMNCYIEVSKQNPLSDKDKIDVDDLRKSACILVALKEQKEIEKDFYENIIGLKCHYLFCDDIEEARLLVSINRGFMPVEYVTVEQNQTTKVIPLYRNDRQIQRNYCAFWKKERNHYYIEEFVRILENKMNSCQ